MEHLDGKCPNCAILIEGHYILRQTVSLVNVLPSLAINMDTIAAYLIKCKSDLRI